MKKRTVVKSLFLVLVAFALAGSVALAYTYRAPYVVSNNSTTAYTMLGATVNSSNQWMADNGFMGSSALDTHIETLSGLLQPHMVTENRTQVAIPVPASSQTNLYFTTGSSNLTHFPVIPGYDGYVTVEDAANIELSDNFSVLFDGWINTVSDNISADNLIYKRGAFKTYIASTGNLTAAILAETSETLRPDGHHTCAIPSEVGAACNNHHQNVDEAIADDAATQNYAGGTGATYTDWYTADNTSIRTDERIHSVTLHIKGLTADLVSGMWFSGNLRLGTDTTMGTHRLTNNVWTAYSETMARPGGGNWQPSDFDDLLIGITVKAGAGGGTEARVTQVYVVIVYDDVTAQVSATGLSSGEHSCNVSAVLLLWALGNDLNFDATAGSVLDCGVIYDAQAKLWNSLWFKLDSSHSASDGNRMIWNKSLGGNDYIRLQLATATGRLNFFHIAGGGTAFNISSVETSWAADIWYHVIASTSSAAGVRLIVNNGTPVTNADVTALPNGGNFYIGDRVSGSGFGFIGEIANWVTGTDDLSPAEELALYNNTFPGDETDLWYIDEGTGTTIISYGSATNNGTAGAACTWQYETRPCKFAIAIDGTSEDGFARPVSVPDTSDNWIMYQNNSLIYSDNFSIVVNGTTELWFRPTGMIESIDASTANLTDRTNVYNHGILHWGSNPTGVTVTLGSMVSTAQPALGEAEERPIEDITPDVEVSDWFVEPDVSGTLLTNPIRPFVTMLSDNSTLTEMQSWRLLGLALILLVTVGTIIGTRGEHLGIASIMAGAATGLMVALTIYPFWALAFTIGMVVGGLVSERSPSL